MRLIITGAASGIGRATGNYFAAEPIGGEPAEILLVDRDGPGLADAVKEVQARGGRAVSMVADLADAKVAGEIVDYAVKTFGGLDALISNAGAIHMMPLLAVTAAEFDRLININARATLLLGQAVHPHLKASKGAIVATVSTAADHPSVPSGAYSASKSALLMLVRQMAAEWGADGIRCNGVSPGPTHTAMTKAAYDNAAIRDKRGKDIPLGRVGEPDDLAKAIHFLASPAAAFISGINLTVDGGLSSTVGIAKNGAASQIVNR